MESFVGAPWAFNLLCRGRGLLWPGRNRMNRSMASRLDLVTTTSRILVLVRLARCNKDGFQLCLPFSNALDVESFARAGCLNKLLCRECGLKPVPQWGEWRSKAVQN